MAILYCWARLLLARLSGQKGPPSVSCSLVGLETVLHGLARALSWVPHKMGLRLCSTIGQGHWLCPLPGWSLRLCSQWKKIKLRWAIGYGYSCGLRLSYMTAKAPCLLGGQKLYSAAEQGCCLGSLSKWGCSMGSTAAWFSDQFIWSCGTRQSVSSSVVNLLLCPSSA